MTTDSRPRAKARVAAIAIVAVVAGIALVVAVTSFTGPSAAHLSARDELRGYLEDIPGSTFRTYDLHDDLGQPMGPGAITTAPNGEGFASVYFVASGPDGAHFDVHLATSPDLRTWTWRAKLADSASQPTIEPSSDGGYVVGWEAEPPNHLQFAWYATWADLLDARYSKFFDVPMTLSDCAEGTPSFYEASSTFLDVGFHFYDDCLVDRPARGTTDWKTWRANPRPQLESAIRRFDVQAGVGDRDTITFRGFDFTLQEAMAVPDHWESFRVYLYDDATGKAEPLNLRTDAGCVAFTNPVVEIVELDGRPTLVAGMFVPGEAGHQCEAGGLLYTTTLDDS